MDLRNLIKSRRSVRLYDLKKKVSEEQIREILEAGVWAPTAGNVQPWHFYYTLEPEIKGKLVRAAYGQSFIAEAPLVIIVCANLKEASYGYGTRGANLYCIQDTAAATQNMILVAHSLGLSSCWVGAFDEKSVARIIDCPKSLRPIVILPVGYPGETPKAPRRKPLESVSTHL